MLISLTLLTNFKVRKMARNISNNLYINMCYYFNIIYLLLCQLSKAQCVQRQVALSFGR